MLPHSCRTPRGQLENDICAVFAHGPEICWAFESCSPRTGGCLRMAVLEARPLHPKPHAAVEARSMRLRGEDAQGWGMVWVGK